MTKFDEEAYRKIGQQIQDALYSTEDTRQDFRLRLSMLVECLANELARTDIEELGPIMDEFAEQIVQKPTLATRYARVALTQQLKRAMLDNLGYGLALEGLGALSAAAARG